MSERTTPSKKQRLDLLLVEQRLADSRERAKRLIMAGEVKVDGQPITKPGTQVSTDATVEVTDRMPYVSRGGIKLAAALDSFGIPVVGREAVDVGASTGGFTDCLLQYGARHVYAIDVGYGQLAWKLRNDTRVTVIERTNIRYLEQLPHGAIVDLAVIDASFISLQLVLPPTLRLLTPHADIVALIKPQFEAGKQQVGKGGVIRDERVHRQVIQQTWEAANQQSLGIGGLCASPLLGPAGNAEFLIWMRRGLDDSISADEAINDALATVKSLRKE